MPLNREVALIGRFRRESSVVAVGQRSVAWVNSRTAGLGWDRRFVFSSEEDFTWLGPDRRLCNAREFVEACRRPNAAWRTRRDVGDAARHGHERNEPSKNP